MMRNSTIRVLVPSGKHDNPTDVGRALAHVGGPENITIVSCRAHPDYEFQTLQAIAQKEGISSVRSSGLSEMEEHRLLLDEELQIPAFDEQPWVMVSSDGGIGSRHPRGTGTYPRVLGWFVRELRWLTLTEAIRKMTSLLATRFNEGTGV